MGLPARQVRALGRMETGLRADEPHLASMFGIFARLAVGQPSAAPASHSATRTAGDLAFPPAAGSPAVAGYGQEMCYK